MAEKVKFQPQTFDINSINNGDKYNLGDGVSNEAINAPIEAAAYVQSLATNQPNVENANKVGVPTVSIELAPNGTPRFKFEELKGEDHSAEIQKINNSISALKSVQKDHSAEIQANSSSIETLEKVLIKKGQMNIIEVEQAYTTRETAAGRNIVDEQNTDVTMIKGSTVSCKNLFNPNKHFNSPDYVVEGDKVTISSSVSYVNYKLNLKAGIYTISGIGRNIAIESIVNDEILNPVYGVTLTNGATFTVPEGAHSVRFYFYSADGGVYENIMLNEGSTALPYQPYFTGLKHAYINSIKSTGRNLFDLTKGWQSESHAVEGDKVTISSSVSYVNYKLNLKAGIYTILGIGGNIAIESIVNDEILNPVYGVTLTNGATFTVPEGAHSVRFYFYSADGGVYENIMLNYGATALPFEPYTEDIYRLPETLELGEWDSLNPQTGELVRATGRVVFDGTEEWFYGENDAGIYFANYRDTYHGTPVITNKFRNGIPAVVGLPCAYLLDEGLFVVFPNADKNNPVITTADEWNTKILEWYTADNPLEIEFALATPTTETIANVPKTYKAYNHGSETVNQGETDNSDYGAMPTITNEYVVVLGVEE